MITQGLGGSGSKEASSVIGNSTDGHGILPFDANGFGAVSVARDVVGSAVAPDDVGDDDAPNKCHYHCHG